MAMTDNEIIKAFEVCEVKTYPHCKECPLKGNPTNCRDVLHDRVYKIINRQKAEIESLGNSVRLQTEMLYEAKSDAIKEFAERLKKRCDAPHWCVWLSDIDDVVKEMEGDYE